MAVDYRQEAFPILRDFLSYHENIQAHSQKTITEYFLDLRTFFRYIKMSREPELRDQPFDEISIANIGMEIVASVSFSDILDFMGFLSRERTGSDATGAIVTIPPLAARSKARKQASIRSFYNYLTKTMHLLENNPAASLDAPKLKKTLPQYLDEEECDRLLEAVDGPYAERNYCIILLFLTCGLRIGELVGINLNDIHGDILRVRGKGNKERILYLSEACLEALEDYLDLRDGKKANPEDQNALFLSRNHRRITPRAVQQMVEKTLLQAGLDASRYSPHKLRHTAATLMLQNGVDVRTLQDVLGHDNLNTTQIYTHIDNEGLRVAVAANPISKRKKKSSLPTTEE